METSGQETEEQRRHTDQQHAGCIEEQVAPEIVCSHVHGDCDEEVEDEARSGDDAESGDPDACDQSGRRSRLDGRHQPPVFAWPIDTSVALRDEGHRLHTQKAIDERDYRQQDDGPDGIRKEQHSNTVPYGMVGT